MLGVYGKDGDVMVEVHDWLQKAADLGLERDAAVREVVVLRQRLADAPVGVADGFSVWSDRDGVEWSLTVRGVGPLPDGWTAGQVALVPVKPR